MDKDNLRILLDFLTGRIDREQFLLRYPGDPTRDKEYVCRQIQHAFAQQDSEGVFAGVVIGHRFGFSDSCVPLLNALLTEGWHQSHEDIAEALQLLHSPSSVDVLYRAAQMQFDYLDYDESCSLATKCCWALGAIGTADADERLRDLAQSENATKARAATRELRHRNKPLNA